MKTIFSNEKFVQQLREALEVSRDIRLTPKPQLVVVCVDGAAVQIGEIIQTTRCTLPIITNMSDELPACVNQDTLVVCVSYSGNAPEVLQCAQEAVKMKTRLMIVTSGGKLLAFAQAQSIVRFQLPVDRTWSIGLTLMPLLMLLVRNHCVLLSKEEVEEGIRALVQSQVREKAAEIALQIGDRTPCVYAGNQLAASVWCVKESLSRVAKVIAHVNTFPAMLCTDAVSKQSKSYVLLVRDECESRLVQTLLDQYKNKLREQKVPCTEVMLRGKKKWNKILLSMILGEFIAYFLAKRQGIDV